MKFRKLIPKSETESYSLFQLQKCRWRTNEGLKDFGEMALKSLIYLLLATSAVLIGGTSIESRIINSNQSRFSPYYARLIAYNADYSIFSRGSGTFISLKHILTSASFVQGKSQIVIQYGATDLADIEEWIVYPTMTPHPNFDATTFENDIAIITLPREVENLSIIPVAIMIDPTQPDHRLGDVFGFGWALDSGVWRENQNLYTFQTSWIADDECRELLGDRAELLASTHFCAEDFFETASVCHGDIGTGFVMFIDGVYYVTGVLSVFTNMCHPSFPALYTRVADFAQWISAVILN